MSPSRLTRTTLTEQTAGFIRNGIRIGRWRVRMPGQGVLAREFGVSATTVYGALRLLMEEGVLVSGGNGCGALIAPNALRESPAKAPKRMLRVALLSMMAMKDMDHGHYLDMSRLARDLENDGHSVVPVGFPSGKSPRKTGYLAKLVRETDADVWLVHLGTHEVLEWFSVSGLTVLAMGGRIVDLPLPKIGANVAGGVVHTVRRLTTMGHRSIVLITPESWRLPTPGLVVKEFAREMEEAGIRTSEFNLPVWTETREGLARLLDSLFRVTPPTALICIAPHSVAGALGWLHAHGFRVPDDVSLVGITFDTDVEWGAPDLSIARMNSNSTAFWRWVREWVADVAEGRTPPAELWTKVELIEGNTMAPPPPSRT